MLKKYWLQFVLCGLFTIFYLIATRSGNQNTSDSIWYKGIAENIYYRGKIYCPDGQPLVYWPPLYPLILAVGLPIYAPYVFWLHLLTAWGVILLWLKIAEELIPDRFCRILFGFAFTLSTPLLMIATFVWSELIFLLLFSLYLLYLQRYIRSDQVKWLWWSTPVGFLMLLQRNAGIFLLAGIFLGLCLLRLRDRLNFQQISREILHFTIVVSGFTAWNVKKIIFEQHQHIFDELPSRITIPERILLIFGEFNAALLPHQFDYPFGILGVFSIFALFIYFAWQRFAAEPFPVVMLASLLVYTGVFLCILSYQDETSRYLSIAMPIFYFLVFYCLYVIMQALRREHRVWLIGLSVCSLIYPLIRIIHNALLWSTRG